MVDVNIGELNVGAIIAAILVLLALLGMIVAGIKYINSILRESRDKLREEYTVEGAQNEKLKELETSIRSIEQRFMDISEHTHLIETKLSTQIDKLELKMDVFQNKMEIKIDNIQRMFLDLLTKKK
jgi:hypothetical protein